MSDKKQGFVIYTQPIRTVVKAGILSDEHDLTFEELGKIFFWALDYACDEADEAEMELMATSFLGQVVASYLKEDIDISEQRYKRRVEERKKIRENAEDTLRYV